MRTSRREFTFMAWAALLGASRAGSAQCQPGGIGIVLAPSNLGLRPQGGKQPGTWRAPQVLMDAGLAAAVGAAQIVRLERPAYELQAQAGTRVRNGQTIRAFSLQLSEQVHSMLRAGRFPLVVGGDCSVLLGCLYGARLAGGQGLVHVDGHSDFSHPGNYDTTKVLGAAAGMDLALASGRGEALLTHWPQVGTPLASEADIVQVGERYAGTPGFMQYYGDILRTQITQITAQRVLAEGVAVAARAVIARLESRNLGKVWMHVDLDVLDEAVMPAVDSPGSPGFTYEQLAGLIRGVRASGRICGIAFTIYDPDRDRGAHAPALVRCIAEGVREPCDSASGRGRVPRPRPNADPG